jgi:hypothetical protein
MPRLSEIRRPTGDLRGPTGRLDNYPRLSSFETYGCDKYAEAITMAYATRRSRGPRLLVRPTGGWFSAQRDLRVDLRVTYSASPLATRVVGPPLAAAPTPHAGNG